MKVLPSHMLFYMMAQVWRYAERRRIQIVWDYALLTVAYIIMSLQPVVLAQIINSAQAGGDDALRKVIIWSGMYAASIAGFWLFNGPARIIERRLSFHVSHNFLGKMYRVVTEMPLRWHQNHHSGEVISRVGKANGALSGFCAGQFMYFQMFVRFTVGIGALAFYSPWVAVASFVTSAIIIATIVRFDRAIVPLVEKTNEAGHFLGAGIQDYIGNIVTVLAMRLQDSTSAEISRRVMALKPSVWPEINISEAKWALVAILLIVSQSAMTGGYIAVKLWHHDPLNIGSAVAIFQYLMAINQIFFSVMQTFDGLMRQHTDMHCVDDLLADHAKIGLVCGEQRTRAWHNIHIQNLSFTHHEGEEGLNHLHDVDLKIEAGKKTALIGASGSGKTTLLTLLRGLYDARETRVTIDGDVYGCLVPLSGFTSLIPQDTEIFDNTVRYNLTLGMKVPEAAVQQALWATTFDDVLPTLPNGIETDIRERGVNLSGGQKQRLALARGLIAARDSTLLLLDEPTSNVDLPTESAIFDRMFKIFADRAIIVSIHRLHLLPRFDHICLMQDGEIIEQGAFHELIAKGGAFARLWTHHLSQSHVAKEEEWDGDEIDHHDREEIRKTA